MKFLGSPFGCSERTFLEVEMYFGFFRKSIPTLGLAALFVVFFLSGCRAGLISIDAMAPPSGNHGQAISSTKENLATAGGVAVLSTAKIKFTIGYLPTGNSANLTTAKIRSTSAGVINEQ